MGSAGALRGSTPPLRFDRSLLGLAVARSLSRGLRRLAHGLTSAPMDEQQQRHGREGADRRLRPDQREPVTQASSGLRSQAEWPYSANPSSPARSAGIERRSRCRPTPASSSTSARAAANACDLGAAIAACSAPSGTCRARRSRAPADRAELDDAEGRTAPRPRLPQRTTTSSAGGRSHQAKAASQPGASCCLIPRLPFAHAVGEERHPRVRCLRPAGQRGRGQKHETSQEDDPSSGLRR